MEPVEHRSTRVGAGLDAFFHPRTIALIGATEKAGSVGRALLENLRTFPGAIFPVNPGRASVLGQRAFSKLSAVPESIDLAIIATQAPSVPGLVAECVQAGVAAAVVISAGFKECGAVGAELERQMLTEARHGRLRLIGPNCLGLMSPHNGLNATFAATAARPGHVAFISQSGALCSAVLDWSWRENVGFSAFISIGSMLDVGWGDLIDYLCADPHTHGLLLYMESVGDARSFVAAARAAAPTKPIVVLKAGRTAEAAHAAASHTGSLTGSDEVFDAALRRAGVLRVDTVAELFGMAEVLANQPIPAGPRLVIVTNAGGPGALAADTLVLGGGRLAPLSSAANESLDKLLPSHWSHGNPVDILGDATPARFAQAVEIAIHEPDADGILVILTPQAMTDPRATAEQVRLIARQTTKPFLACWMGGDAIAEGRRILHDAGIPMFAFPDAAARAFDYLWHLGSLRRSVSGCSTFDASDQADVTSAALAEAAGMIESARQAGRTILSEYESKLILALHGIPSVETRLASTVDEAVAIAAQLGFPVVLKLHSATITHKSDMGGVQLNLGNEARVREAWQTIRRNVLDRADRDDFRGVTVQPMVASGGLELILGSSLDSQFGPVLLFGAGGRLVEIFKDYVLGFPPLDAGLARELVARTKIFTAFRGVRGQPPVDLSQLAQLLVRFSRLVVEQAGIKEIDLNPLVAGRDQLLALDARIILHPAGAALVELHRPVFLP